MNVEANSADVASVRRLGRRRFVAVCAVAAGGAFGAGTAGAADGAGTSSIGDGASPRSTQEDPEAEVERLEAELERLRRERREALSAMPEDVRRVARDVGIGARPGIVVLHGSNGSLGTAWAVDEEYLLTAAHAVSSGGPVTCWSLEGESFTASVVGADANHSPDVALLAADHGLPALSTGSSTSLESEEPLVQVGHPGNFGYWVLAAGPYLHRDRPHAFASEVPILIGNSGSPVLDADGEVVGISTSATISEEQDDAWGEPFRDDDVLHEPVRPVITTYHVPIESALDRVEEWT